MRIRDPESPGRILYSIDPTRIDNEELRAQVLEYTQRTGQVLCGSLLSELPDKKNHVYVRLPSSVPWNAQIRKISIGFNTRPLVEMPKHALRAAH